MVAADGSTGPVQIGDPDMDVWTVAWSPDGRTFSQIGSIHSIHVDHIDAILDVVRRATAASGLVRWERHPPGRRAR